MRGCPVYILSAMDHYNHILSIGILLFGFCAQTTSSESAPVISSFKIGNVVTDLVYRWPGDILIFRAVVNGDPTPNTYLIKDRSDNIIHNGANWNKRANITTDPGVYWIVANNSIGTAISSKVTLKIYYLNPWPTTGLEDEVVTISKGQYKIIDVPSIDAQPAASRETIKWIDISSQQAISQNNKHFQVTESGQLVVLDAEPGFHQARYQPKYENLLSETSRGTIFILSIADDASVNRLAPEVVIPLPAVTPATADRNFKLECVVNARPIQDLVINWYVTNSVDGNRRLVTTNLDNVSGNRVLEKFLSSSDHDDIYECEAILTGFNPVTTRTKLEIHEEPTKKLPELRTRYEVDLNTQLNLPCSMDGYPTPTIVWYKNGVQTETGPRTSISSNGTLTLYNVELSDSAVYQCSASNTVGEIWSHTFVQIISSPPIITTAPRDVTKVAPDEAMIMCSAQGKPEPTLKWIFRSDGVDTELGNGRSITITPDSLRINPSQWSDSGTYICSATNSLGSVSEQAEIIVYNRTTIRGVNTNRDEEKGAEVSRYCLLDKDSRVPATIQWFKNDVPLQIDSQRSLSDNNQILTFKQMRTTKDQGIFTCRVTSIAGNESISHNITIYEVPQKVPDITAILFNSTNQPRTILLQWSQPYNGNRPLLRYIIRQRMIEGGNWFIQNDSVPATALSYKVSRLKPSKSYEFKVTAVNSFGTGQEPEPTAPVTIPVEPPTAPPSSVSAEALSSTQIRVRWSSPPEEHHNGELEGYVIQYYTSAGSTNKRTETVENPGASQHVLADLLVYQQYSITVAAYNSKGVGVPSNPIREGTGEGTPEVAPSITSAVSSTSTTVDLTWMRPDTETIHGMTRGYYISVYKNGVGTPKNLTVPKSMLPGREEHTTLAELDKYTLYRIVVLLYTDGGVSPPSEITVTTQQDKPERVVSFRDQIITHDSITFTWAPPSKANGILTDYRMTVSGGGINGTEYIINHPTTNKTIGSLLASTEYIVDVQAGTVKGYGPSSIIRTKTRPPPEKPQPPTDLDISKNTIASRAVVIGFEPGDDGKAPIEEWEVEAMVAGDGKWNAISVFRGLPDARELLVDGLSPYTEYQFRISAQNIAGKSNASLPTEPITTEMDKPDHAPLNVTIRPQNKTTLIINWEPLERHAFNGEPAGYNISYKSEFEDNWQSQMVDDPMDRFLIVGGLQPFTTYTMKVTAKNSEFSSDPSVTALGRTIESVPRVAPRIVLASVTNSSSIQLQWEPLSLEDSHGIVLGYKVMYKNVPTGIKRVITTEQTNIELTGLDKYTSYDLQVLAFTRIGDGIYSPDNQRRRTQADVPGPPARLALESVERNRVILSWQTPDRPNGPTPLKYRVSYRGVSQDTTPRDTRDLVDRVFTVGSLSDGVEYVFSVSAQNAASNTPYGEPTRVTVITTSSANQDPPSMPRNFMVTSRITATSLSFSWDVGSNGGLPIRNYTLQYRNLSSATYTTPSDPVPGDATSYTLEDLSPFTKYYFKLSAVNDKGSSDMTAIGSATTLTAAPSLPPSNLIVVPHSESSLNVSWTEAPTMSWNSPVHKTRIWFDFYEPESRKKWSEFQHLDVSSQAKSWMLNDLEQSKLYEIRVSTLNDGGYSISSEPVIVYVGVAVPTGSPSDVKSEMVSDKKILVSWNPLDAEELNGQLLGYKVYYEPTTGRTKRSAQRGFDLVAPDKISHEIDNLEIFTEYIIYITAYNIAGEGPRSGSVVMTTDEGAPGKPNNLQFSEITLRLINVTWDEPDKPNGNITEYIISYYQIIPGNAPRSATGGKFTEVVVGSNMHDEITVGENKKYNFSIEARTRKGGGDTLYKVHETGPYPGVPPKPTNAEYIEEEDGATIRWEFGPEDAGVVLGYVIEGLSDDWHLVHRGAERVTKKSLSPEQIVHEGEPYSDYRVSVFNANGLGEPAQADKVDPFYKTWWFLVIVALAALILILVVVAVLCCEFFKRRAKLAEEAYENDVIGGGDPQYNTYEMRQSFKRDTRRASKYREPPRPSPGALSYDVDEVPPGYEDSSDVTEKGDLESSDDDEKKGHMSSDSSDDDMEKRSASCTPSYNHYQYGGYNRYVSSGAVQQSWQNSYKARNGKDMYTYTDSEAGESEATSSHYRPGLSLASSHTETPGSRAPLPGFSSFV